MSRPTQGAPVDGVPFFQFSLSRGEAGIVVASLEATIEDRGDDLDEASIAAIKQIRDWFAAVASPKGSTGGQRL